MNESDYMKYNYNTSNIQNHIINSLNLKEEDYNIINDEHISNMRKNASNRIIRNKYSTR